ncbi:MAG: hypothetical protein RLZZ290_515 [Pseudomonadota bacterium]
MNPEQASARAQRLLDLLDLEFEALKDQSLDRFEALQAEKAEILSTLSQLSLPSEGSADRSWETFRDHIRECKTRHRRNEILLLRKLDAIRAALRTLQGPDPLNAVEVYDRMGRLSGLRRGRGLADA